MVTGRTSQAARGHGLVPRALRHGVADREPLYLGQAFNATVRQRWQAEDNLRRVFRPMERELGLYHHVLLVGDVATGARLTKELLRDIESALIMCLQPWANVSCMARRTRRPGMQIRNLGKAWVGPRVINDAARGLQWC